VYVKSLTLRGFKSFASATSLRFEPGITCVVGPNGSGKSNIVDAFAWVMGEQGAKSLRGGKMDDVVFAGTASRPPLGRAEVTLTIDNTDGALPIDYTEVTISRLLFRSGQSEYAINGNQCRLLDVTELLSDSGLGREMHVIVGQGQLDEVLHAGPEARRALIEEAAGVLKHRRRKEKALRKLEAMQVNLTRLVDLTGELRRRLGPLGRQAAIARRAATIQADLRDARLRLLADDFAGAAAALERGEADEAAALARRAELENLLAQARRQEAALDAGEQQHAPRLAAALNTWFELSSLAERLRGVANLARERHSLLAADEAPARPGRDPGELDAEAASLREQEAVLGEALEAARAAVGRAAEGRTAAEADLAAAERLLADQARAAAARADQLARLRGQVGAARSRVAASEEEAARLADAIEQARSRAEFARREHEEAQEMAGGGTDDGAGMAAAHEEAAAALAESSACVAECRAAERIASAERAALDARRQALEEGLAAVQDGTAASAALLADPEWAGHVLGGVAALLTVAEGAQEAITAALGGAADAVAVAGLDAAVAILYGLKGADAGTAGLVIAETGSGSGHVAGAWPSRYGVAGDLLPGVVPAADLVKAPAELTAALAGLLAGVVVADDLAAARDVVRARPELKVVTRDGDLLGAHWAHGGSARPPSMLAMRAAAEEASAALAAAERAAQEAGAALARALAGEERDREATGRALAGVRAADKAAAESSGRLGRLAGAARAAQEEAARLEAAIASVATQRARDAAALAGVVAKLAEAEASEDTGYGDGETGQEPGAPQAPDRDSLVARASAAREAETDARLEVRTAEERLRAIAGRADALAAAAVRERRAAEAAVARRRLRAQQADVARAVAAGADAALAKIAESLATAQADREAAEQASKGRSEALKDVRSRVRAITADLDRVVDTAHGAEVSRAEQRMRVEQVVARAAEEFGVDTATLLAEYGPGVPVPVFEEPEQATSRRRRTGSAAQAGPAQGTLARGGLVQHGAGQSGSGQNGSGQNGSGQNGSSEGGSGQSAGKPSAAGHGLPGNGASSNGSSRNGADASAAAQDGQHPDPAEPGMVRIPAARSAAHSVAGTAEEGLTADGLAQDAPAAGTADRPAEPIRTIPYVRAEQEKRAATAQRQLDQLGKVNPLALEEYAALEERHQFLATQLEDLKKTRRDLLTVVKEVDDRVQQVFTSAFADTATEFEQIFSRLFPGGEGRLVLTEPDDMLATGIDVEARPPGKKVKRLSLLSGGERSLTAIAFLLAIFKARPSPFYVLDEVEAALDDTNLQRLLGIFEEMRGISQLIIVTHQKRTMEVADALYGTSMQGDGVSAVVSQRLRERERA